MCLIFVPGQCLNFDCMLILVFMLRQCITFLRTRGFSAVLPLDQHIYFHKLTGMLIFTYSILHTIMHLCNFGMYQMSYCTSTHFIFYLFISSQIFILLPSRAYILKENDGIENIQNSRKTQITNGYGKFKTRLFSCNYTLNIFRTGSSHSLI